MSRSKSVTQGTYLEENRHPNNDIELSTRCITSPNCVLLKVKLGFTIPVLMHFSKKNPRITIAIAIENVLTAAAKHVAPVESLTKQVFISKAARVEKEMRSGELFW